MTTDNDDVLMSTEDYQRKGLLPDSPPGFGWYKVRAGWVTPAEDIVKKTSEKTGSSYTMIKARLNATAKLVFVPDPENDKNALMEEERELGGRLGFFYTFFLGSHPLRNALEAMGRKIESTGDAGNGIRGEDVYNALKDGEAWVRLYHKKNETTGEWEHVIAQWTNRQPLQTYVHPDHAQAFIDQAD